MVLEVATGPDGRRRVVKASGDKEHPTNFGRLCTKGATSADMLVAEGRMETAYLRTERGAPPTPTPVDAAITETARRLRALLDEHGPDALSFYVSGQMSIEAQYLSNKLAKGFVRTNQIESNSRLCMASAGTGYKQSLGADGPPGSYQDFEHADVFFVIGANMADCHPILFLRMMERVKAGAKLIVVDPRRSATADKATLYLPIRPGTDLALLNGLLRLIVESGHTDPEFIAEFTEGWDAMPEFLADYPPATVAELTGLPEADIRQAAEWIGTAANWMTCWTMGLNQSTHGTWNTNAICNLHLATGAICQLGSGPFSLTGQPNAMGGREMGYLGPGLPGQRSVLDAGDREFVEREWGLPPDTLRTEVGAGTVDMYQRMRDGQIKACWIICTNPVATVANRRTVIEGLEAAELVITQDVFTDTETNAYADIMLPGALWAEATSVTVNSERNLTLLDQAVDPVGEALPDWQIIARVGREMGFAEAFSYESSEEVFEEIKRFWNPKTGWDIRGVSYQRLRETPVQWPSPSGDGPDRNPIRYVNDGVSQRLLERPDGGRPRLAFATASGRAAFFPRPHMPAVEMPDDGYPFILNTGRLQHQWHTLTKTGKVAKLNKLNPGPFLEIHPEDAEKLGIVDTDRVEVASRRGRSVLPAVVTDRVQVGNCFAPFHWNDSFGDYLAINAVTNDAVDPVSFQPEFKICAVTLTRVGPAEQPAVEPAVEPAAPGSAGAQFGGIARALGFESVLGPPAFDPIQTNYLQGFLWALQNDPSRAGAGALALPSNAPFDGATRAWVDGALAALLARPDLNGSALNGSALNGSTLNGSTLNGSALNGSGPAPAGPAGSEPVPVVLLWASQTGNAEEHAAEYAERLKVAGHPVELVGMDDYDVAGLPAVRYLLLVSSTFGDGEAPDNGGAFWAAVSAETMPRLENTRFAVLAFGDSNYDVFCGHGRRLDERFTELGAARLTDRVDCEPDERAPADAWYEKVAALLAEPATPDPNTGTPGAAPAASAPATTSPVPAGPTGAPTNGNGSSGRYSKNRPLRSFLVTNVQLNAEGSSKDVRSFSLGLSDPEFEYAAGDALGVYPVNCDAVVAEWLAVTGLDPEAPVSLDGLPEMPLREAARDHLEIARVTPNLLKFIQERAQSRELDTLMRPGNTTNLQAWLWGRQSMDVLAEFPVRAEPAEWLRVLKKLQPRLYSISSSPKLTPDEVHLTVSAVRYQHQGTPRYGVCSTFLADRGHNRDIKVFVQRSAHFRPPADPATPMVMIGPGTGIAPFRAFLQERRQRGHTGSNWLFFGERNAATDFYYRDELLSMHDDGLLTRLDTAFSRDQRRKIYVQDLMREHAAELWRWLEDGAHLYVCGDAARMAKDVDLALRDVVRQRGHLDAEQADGYVKRLSVERRYVRDVY
jgi:NADPH-dependent sulfite reductase flavoprotein alpha-component